MPQQLDLHRQNPGTHRVGVWVGHSRCRRKKPFPCLESNHDSF